MADIKIGYGVANPGFATGNVDLTIAGFGTPKALIVWQGITSFFSIPIISPAAQIAVGIAVDGAQASASFAADDNVGTTQTAKRASLSHVLTISNGVLAEIVTASSVGPIVDGWRISFATNPAGRAVFFALLGGADLQANIAPITAWPNPGPGAITWPAGTGTGQFQADTLIGLGSGQAFDNVARQHGSLGFGFAGRAPLVNRAVCFGSQDNVGTVNATTHVSEAGVIGARQDNPDIVKYLFAASNFTATGFDLTRIQGSDPGADDGAILGLGFGGNAFAVGTVDSPITAASDWIVTDPGFQPGAVMLASSFAPAVDVDATGADAVSFGLGVADDQPVQTAMGPSDQDGVTTSNTATAAGNEFGYFAAPDGTLAFQFKDPTFTASGWTVAAASIAAADGTARKWPYLAVELEAAPGGFVDLQGAIEGVGDIAGTLSVGAVVDLAGAIEGVGDIAGTLSRFIDLAGAIDGVGDVTGTLSVGEVVELQGALEGVGDITGTLSRFIDLQGAIDGIADVAGSLSIAGIVDLQGAIDGVGDMTGTLSRIRDLQGALEGVGDVAGSLTKLGQVDLRGTLEGVGDINGILSVGSVIDLSGAFDGIGDIAGNLTIAGPVDFSGQLEGVGDITGRLVKIGAVDFRGATRNLVSLSTQRTILSETIERTLARLT